MNYAVQSTNKHTSAFQYVMDNPAWEFTDEDDTKGFKKTDKDYHKTNKETYEIQPSKTLFKWLLQQPFGCQFVSTSNWRIQSCLWIIFTIIFYW